MASYGLVQVKSNTEINNEEAQKLDAINRVPTEYESRLSAHIKRVWEQNRWAKERWEDEMLACLRQRNGEYDPETLASIMEQGGSEIYMMLTATKIRAAVSWIRDILVPAGDKPWGLSPTPVPELPNNLIDSIGERIAATLPNEEPEEGYQEYIAARAGQLRDEIMKTIRDIAEKSSERMETKIEDQLTEGGWAGALTDFIEDFCTFPAAIMKGPIPRKKTKLTWGPTGEPEVSEKVVLEYERVSPFDCYPSPYASEIDDGEFIERVRFTRRKIYDLLGMPGYNDEAIRAVLQEYGRGGLRDWLWRDYERARLEGKDKYWLRQDEGSIDGLHYFGSAQGLMLLEWGIDPDQIADPLGEYEIDAVKIGRHVIRAVINRDPLKRRGYHKASFQKIPGGFWGIAIPKLMRDHQRMCNATARALANNLGISSGPMVEVETDRLADGEVVEQLYPWKIIQTKSDKTGRGKEAVRFFQPRSNAAELLTVYEQFERRADDATSIPRYAYGNEAAGGAGRTASGLSMLMNNASKGIKLAISSIDSGVITQIIEETFTFNMLYDPDPSIKGDVSIVARGATAMLTREQTQLRRSEFLNMTNNPTDMQIMGVQGRLEVLRATADILDLNTDKVVPTQDQFIARQQEMAQQGGQEEDPKVTEMKAKMEFEQNKIGMQNQQFKEKLAMQAQSDSEKIRKEEQALADKLEKEYDYKLRLLEEDSRQKEFDRDIEREKEEESRAVDVHRISEQVKLEREAKESENESGEDREPIPQLLAPTINLVIDNKSGEVRKTIDIKRGADKMIESAEITEYPIDGEN